MELFIKNQFKLLDDKIFISPNIPDKKMNGAIKGIAPEASPDYVLAILDTTVFGSAKEGLLCTGEKLYIKAITSKSIEINFSQISSVDYDVDQGLTEKGKEFKNEFIKINMKDGSIIDITEETYAVNKEKLATILNNIVEKSLEDFEFVSTIQTLPLALMQSEVKVSYIKLVCNYSFSYNRQISPAHYAEISSLIVRINIEPSDRFEIRGYMTNYENMVADDKLLEIISDKINFEDFEMIKQSLIKDIISISRKTNKHTDWNKDKYIVTFVNKLQVKYEQVEVINEAIINDEDIITKRKNDSEIEKGIKDLASKVGAVGVPLAAIYLSGSVVGVSAAGISSGLATLGLGGLLGFSSMFTGIGVAVLVGVGTYKGLRKITGIGDIENNKQRELMLQAIIINSQKSLNYLIEDVNEITRRLTEEISKGLQTKFKIEELTMILSMLSGGAQITSDRISYAEKEKIIANLPITLDEVRLKELTNTAKKTKLYDTVMSCYRLEEKSNEKVEYKLDDSCTIDELSNLINIFETIEYNKLANASIASIKGSTKNFIESILD